MRRHWQPEQPLRCHTRCELFDVQGEISIRLSTTACHLLALQVTLSLCASVAAASSCIMDMAKVTMANSQGSIGRERATGAASDCQSLESSDPGLIERKALMRS